MIGLGTAALISGGGALAKYGMARYNASRRRYSGTALGKEYARIKREGAITDEMQSNIIGKQNRVLSSQAGGVRARTQGRLINQGLEGSIAGTRALAQPNIERMRELGYTTRDLAAQNAQTKVDASLRYAEGETAYNAETDAMKRGANQELVGDAIAIGGEYALGKISEAKALKASDLEQKRYDTSSKENILRYEQGRMDKFKAGLPKEAPDVTSYVDAFTALSPAKQIEQLPRLHAKLIELGLTEEQAGLMMAQMAGI